MTAVTDQHTILMRELLRSCYKAGASFRSAAEVVSDVATKRLFEIYAQQRVRFAEELRAYTPFPMDECDETYDRLNGRAGTDDQLRNCLKINARVLALYRDALAARALPTRAQFVVSAQLALMEPVQDRMAMLVQGMVPVQVATQTITA